jgi:hypothetical protein
MAFVLLRTEAVAKDYAKVMGFRLLITSRRAANPRFSEQRKCNLYNANAFYHHSP